jgi:hypothetical protein
MFILIGSYFIGSGNSVATQSLVAPSEVRSDSTEVALPPQIGCSSSHAGHTGH